MNEAVVTAKEIQSEILAKQENVLSIATKLMESKKQNQEHVAGLQELGFTGASSVLTRKMEEAKRIADLVDMYSFEYPGLKFIPSEVMAEVCNKYGLAIGHVSRYTGEVPEWALAQIKSNAHHINRTIPMRGRFLYSTHNHEKRTQKDVFIFEDGTQDEVLVPDNDNATGRAALSARRTGESYEASEMQMIDFFMSIGRSTVEAPVKFRTNLMIAAPVKEMAIESNEQVVNGDIVAIPTLDPIVCLEVKGGYIVLAAWGEEGQDPKVFNAESN